MKKRLLSLFTCFSIIFTLSFCPFPAFAASVSNTDVEIENTITIPVETEETPHGSSRVTNFGEWRIYRSNGERCELSITWSGSCRFSAFQYREIEICSTSAIFKETYDVLGDGENKITINFPSTSIGSAYIDVVHIPTDVDHVTVYTPSDTKVYDVTHGMWIALSLNAFGKYVEVSSTSPESIVVSWPSSAKTSRKNIAGIFQRSVK